VLVYHEMAPTSLDPAESADNLSVYRNARADHGQDAQNRESELMHTEFFQEVTPEAAESASAAEDPVQQAPTTSETIAVAGDSMKEVPRAVSETEAVAGQAQPATREAVRKPPIASGITPAAGGTLQRQEVVKEPWEPSAQMAECPGPARPAVGHPTQLATQAHTAAEAVSNDSAQYQTPPVEQEYDAIDRESDLMDTEALQETTPEATVGPNAAGDAMQEAWITGGATAAAGDDLQHAPRAVTEAGPVARQVSLVIGEARNHLSPQQARGAGPRCHHRDLDAGEDAVQKAIASEMIATVGDNLNELPRVSETEAGTNRAHPAASVAPIDLGSEQACGAVGSEQCDPGARRQPPPAQATATQAASAAHRRLSQKQRQLAKAEAAHKQAVLAAAEAAARAQQAADRLARREARVAPTATAPPPLPPDP